MLKFLKNTVSKGRSNCPKPPVENGQNEETASSTITNFFEDMEYLDSDISMDITEQSSKLSLSFTDTIRCDKSLRYFREFMTSILKAHVLECYFEIEKFITNTTSTESDKTKIGAKRIEQIDNSDSKLNNDTNKAIVEDAVKIFKQYVALESPQKMNIPDDIRSAVISSICQPEGTVDLKVFATLKQLIREELEKVYFERFTHTIFHCKYQIDVLTSGSFELEDFIFNQMALFYFMEYLEQENLRLLLEFVMAVISYRDQLKITPNYDPEEAQKDAIILYDKYFSLQATSPLGFSSKIRLETENNICNEEGTSPDCFQKPFLLALKVLRQHIKVFCKSQLYYNYLSEMINSTENSWSSTTKHKKSASDCSSDISVGARSCVSMKDVSCSNTTSCGNQNMNMRIDSKLLYNGDMLWRRKSEKGLCLGRVNSLGRFESTMEPDPEKKDGSMIKRVMSKIVSGDKDKAKEEMAWQVAHMIVKDITDVTMGIPENNL